MHNQTIPLSLESRCLAKVDEIAKRFVKQLGQLSLYAEEALTHEELLADARMSIERIIRDASGEDVRAFDERSADIGARRVSAQVPLEDLLEAARLNFTVIWKTLVSQATPEEQGCLADAAQAVWRGVERHTLQMQRGYLNELALLSRGVDGPRDTFVRRYLTTTKEEPIMASRFASAMSVQSDGAWIVASAPETETAPIEEAAKRLRRNRHSTHVLSSFLGTSTLVAFAGPSPNEQEIAECFEGLACAYSIAGSLSKVPESAQETVRLTEVVSRSDTGPLTLRTAWSRLVVNSLGTSANRIADTVLSGLDDQKDTIREPILYTVAVYFETGSVNATAEKTFYHRNTVLNHLRRLQELTNLDPTIPREAALIQLALDVRSGIERARITPRAE